MSKLQPVRGTHDLFGDEARRHLHIADTARGIAGLYGYAPAATPVFEFTDVFQRTLGETSDIVTKEMYTFTDKGGDSLTLRPEGTAGIARAVISGGLQNELPLKCFYDGPMFRHERSATPTAAPPTATCWSSISAATPTGCRRTAANGSTAIRCESSIPRMRATARSLPARHPSPIT